MKRIAPFLLLFLTLPALLYGSNGVTVTAVLSGDTIELSNGEIVRMLGIDSPEVQKNMKLKRDLERSEESESELLEKGRQAKEFTKNLVEGKQVRLEFDLLERDNQGRLLANVYMLANAQVSSLNDYRIIVDASGFKEVFVNATIINSGYAYPLTVLPNIKNVNYFFGLFKEAKQNNRGFWK